MVKARVYTGAYSQLEQMFRKLFKSLTQDYGLIIVAHADLKLDENDPDKKLKYATLAVNKKAKKIVMGLLDLLIFVEADRAVPGVTTMHFKSTQNWEAKSRFPNIVDSGILNYKNIVKSINDAIGDIATAEHHKSYQSEEKTFTPEEYEALHAQCLAVAEKKVETKGVSKVMATINSTLGKKITESDIGDAAALTLLLQELEVL